MFRVSKKNTRTTSNIFKVHNKGPEQRLVLPLLTLTCLVLLFLTWTSFILYSTVIVADFEQTNARWT